VRRHTLFRADCFGDDLWIGVVVFPLEGLYWRARRGTVFTLERIRGCLSLRGWLEPLLHGTVALPSSKWQDSGRVYPGFTGTLLALTSRGRLSPLVFVSRILVVVGLPEESLVPSPHHPRYFSTVPSPAMRGRECPLISRSTSQSTTGS